MGNTLNMHRLVEVATRQWVEDYDQLGYWSGRYVKKLAGAFPSGEIETSSQRQSLLLHVTTMQAQRPVCIGALLEWARVLGGCRWYALQVWDYATAEVMQQYMLEERRRILGGEHPDIILAISNLAVTLNDQAKLDESNEVQQEVLEKMRRFSWRRTTWCHFSDEKSCIDSMMILLQLFTSTILDLLLLLEALEDSESRSTLLSRFRTGVVLPEVVVRSRLSRRG